MPASATTKNVTVNSLPVPTITGASSVCSGATGSLYTTESGNSAYVWTVTGGAITSGAGPNSIAVTWGAAGSGTLTVTYTTPTGCAPSSPTSDNITISPSPDATILAAGPFCSNAVAVNLNALTPGGTWSGTGITNPATGTFDPSVSGPGVFPITYSVTSGGCTDVKTANFTSMLPQMPRLLRPRRFALPIRRPTLPLQRAGEPEMEPGSPIRLPAPLVPRQRDRNVCDHLLGHQRFRVFRYEDSEHHRRQCTQCNHYAGRTFLHQRSGGEPDGQRPRGGPGRGRELPIRARELFIRTWRVRVHLRSRTQS